MTLLAAGAHLSGASSRQPPSVSQKLRFAGKAIASVALLFSFPVQIILAQTATAAPSTPASIVGEKGNQLVTYKDAIGAEKRITFVVLAGMPETEKNVILGQQKRSKQSEFYEFELQAENQKAQELDARIQAANQRIKEKRGVLETTTQEANKLASENIGKLKLKLARGMKLDDEDRLYLEKLATSNRSPINMLAIELLANPTDFAIQGSVAPK